MDTDAFSGRSLITQTIELDTDLLQSLLTLVIEARDLYTGGHSWRVGQYARLLARDTGLSADNTFVCYLGGLNHDLGKIGISDNILIKKGPLDKSETSIIQKHPYSGLQLIRQHPLMEIVHQVVYEHHERIDGNGCPVRKAGEGIVAMADAFDAMTSFRPYRAGMSKAESLDIIRAGSGKQFTGFLVEALFSLDKKGELDQIQGHSSQSRRLATCPVCGPVVVIPRQTRPGDQVYCHACTGIYQLHVKGDGFEIEWTQQYASDLVPETDSDTIGEFIKQGLLEKVHFKQSSISKTV